MQGLCGEGETGYSPAGVKNAQDTFQWPRKHLGSGATGRAKKKKNKKDYSELSREDGFRHESTDRERAKKRQVNGAGKGRGATSA